MDATSNVSETAPPPAAYEATDEYRMRRPFNDAIIKVRICKPDSCAWSHPTPHLQLQSRTAANRHKPTSQATTLSQLAGRGPAFATSSARTAAETLPGLSTQHPAPASLTQRARAENLERPDLETSQWLRFPDPACSGALAFEAWGLCSTRPQPGRDVENELCTVPDMRS